MEKKKKRSDKGGHKPVVTNWEVYGLRDSIKGSKYPMAVDVEKCTDVITGTVCSLGHCAAGTGHDQFLTGIVVQFDLTLSLKAWVEAERYHFLDFVSSQSTMHRIMGFEPTKQCNEWVTDKAIENLNECIEAYNKEKSADNYLRVLYNIPSGFRLTARMTTNYRQLKTIYNQRKTHRLPEWREFCEWCEALPKFGVLVLA